MMNGCAQINPGSVRGQQGAVLMFSLIILLLLTVIGVAAMQTTILQERMAGGQRDRQLAFQAAEATLKQAERRLNAAVLPDFNGQGGRYDEFHEDFALDRQYRDDGAIDWNLTMNSATRATYEGGTFDDLLYEAPEYIMERLPPAARYGDVLASDESVADEEVFRVTARSTGGSGESLVILQTVFRR